jgi:hypothetical protein
VDVDRHRVVARHRERPDAARDRLVVFGGGDPGTTLRDSWEWDGQQRSQRASTTDAYVIVRTAYVIRPMGSSPGRR